MKNVDATNRRMPLAEDTIGPYYPYPFLDDDRSDLTLIHRGLSLRPMGQKILLNGKIIDRDGNTVKDALLEFWQPNAEGIFRTPQCDNGLGLDPCFDGFGRLMTTDQPFEIRTIKPGAYADDVHGILRAPHITVTIFADGITRLVTQIFFDDEPIANLNDPLLASLPEELRSRLIARSVSKNDVEHSYEIKLALSGNYETPFFDDLTS